MSCDLFLERKKPFLLWREEVFCAYKRQQKSLQVFLETNGLIKLTFACWCVRRHPLSCTVACCISVTFKSEPFVTYVLDHDTRIILCHFWLKMPIHRCSWRVARLSFFWCICKEIKFAPVKLFHKAFTISKR